MIHIQAHPAEIAKAERTFDQVDKYYNEFKTTIASVAQILWNTAQRTATTEYILSQIFNNSAVSDFLIGVSRLPVFSKKLAKSFQCDVDSLVLIKQLKFFYNEPTVAVVQKLSILVSRETTDADVLSEWNYVTNVVLKSPLATVPVRRLLQEIGGAECYKQNAEYLEEADPHAVYPTSIYRSCYGYVLAKPDASVIESIMSHTLTTTIKIVDDVLHPDNQELRNIYQSLGRCTLIIDNKVDNIYGEAVQKYFDTHEIKLQKLVFSANEVDKCISTIEKILIALKSINVSSNQPILVVGGGVISDIAGFATALYHRNTPYVMLCTSIVSGIDAGPSPRTCCDGFGFKNLYGAYHPPVLTLTDRSFWHTLHHGWLRHGIAEIIKIAVMKDEELLLLIEQASSDLVWTKFGTQMDDYCGDKESFRNLCNLIIGKAIEGYVRCEYGNLWEAHQCRPHAYGHTWTSGYELPSGMLHGHAVATGMGFGAYLSLSLKWINQDEFDRILKLMSELGLSLWHPIMADSHRIYKGQQNMTDKRGGNLAAPIPRGIGKSGYLNDMPFELLRQRLMEYQLICQQYPRHGLGIEAHCKDVGLKDPATVGCVNKELPEEALKSCTSRLSEGEKKEYMQHKHISNAGHETDTSQPPEFVPSKLCHPVVEEYASTMTQMSSQDIHKIAMETEQQQMFTGYMVGQVEAQFLKMMAQISNAKRVLDVGTFTGMSAMAFAEGLPSDGEVVTLEFDSNSASTADKLFKASAQAHKITLKIGDAVEIMDELHSEGETFDMVFLDAAKDQYVMYYKRAMKMLTKRGFILADNSLCALLYDHGDPRKQPLHEFNEMVKNDPRVEQVVVTLREGVSIIRPINT